jgi:hypothetical protein
LCRSSVTLGPVEDEDELLPVLLGCCCVAVLDCELLLVLLLDCAVEEEEEAVELEAVSVVCC